MSTPSLPPKLTVRRPGDLPPDNRPPSNFFAPFAEPRPTPTPLPERSADERFTETAVVYGMADADYRKIPALSQSSIRPMEDGPEAYRHALLNPKPQTKAMAIGSAVDWLLTGKRQGTPRPFAIVPETLPDEKGQELPWHGGRTVCKQWMEDNPSHIKQADWEKALGAAAAIERRYADLFIGASTQVVVTGKVFGRAVKGLIDVVPPVTSVIRHNGRAYRVLVDVKKVRKGHSDAHEFAKHALQFGYFTQGALYLDLWNDAHAHVSEEQRDAFAFVVVEEEAPHPCAVHLISDDAFGDEPSTLRIGERHYLALIRKIVEHEESGDWEERKARPSLLRVPGYAAMLK